MSRLSDRAAFVVTVEFRLKPGSADAFRAMITDNARSSLAEEPGCRQFDVVLPTGQPDRIFLYEIYDSPEAFEAHKRTPHFLSFDHASAVHVVDKTILTGTRIFPEHDDR